MLNKSFCSTEIVFIENLTDLEKKILQISDLKNTIILLSKSSFSRFKLDYFMNKIENFITKNNHKFLWIDSISSNPNDLDVENLIKKINFQPNTIISIGGGSCIDLGKALIYFFNSKDNIISSLKEKAPSNALNVNFIAVPTTSGTGSEVTSWATIWASDFSKKYSIESFNIKPSLAIIFPQLTIHLDKKLTISTCLDAFCQAIEAFWSKNTNPLVQELSLRAISLIFTNLKNCTSDLKNLEFRKNLSMASLLAGLAFSKTKTTACHSISYPLTMKYHIPHGIAVVMTLVPVLKRNLDSFPNSASLFEIIGSIENLEKWLNDICYESYSLKLSSYINSKEEIFDIAKESFTKERMKNNPVNFIESDIINILNEIY